MHAGIASQGDGDANSRGPQSLSGSASHMERHLRHDSAGGSFPQKWWIIESSGCQHAQQSAMAAQGFRDACVRSY